MIEQPETAARMRAFRQVCALLNPFAEAGSVQPGAAADWLAIEQFADLHGVRPALYKALTAAPLNGTAAAQLSDRLAEFQRLHRFHVMQTTAQIVALAQGFAAAGVAALFFKGAMLGEQIYGGAQYREFNDVDILVAPAQRRRAEQVLEEDRKSTRLNSSHG